MRKNLFISLGLVTLLWLLNYIANSLYLYWSTGWYDYMMHFLGGVSMGYFALGLFGRGKLWKIILFVALIGVGWEVFEYVNKISFPEKGYVWDTTHDLIMDALGAWVAILLSRRGT